VIAEEEFAGLEGGARLFHHRKAEALLADNPLDPVATGVVPDNDRNAWAGAETPQVIEGNNVELAHRTIGAHHSDTDVEAGVEGEDH